MNDGNKIKEHINTGNFIYDTKNHSANSNNIQSAPQINCNEIETLNLDVLNSSNISEKINELKEVMNTGELSDERALNVLYVAFEEAITSGNKDAELLLNTLIKLKKEYPGLTYYISNEGSYQWEDDVFIDESYIDCEGSERVIIHETSHLIHGLIEDYKVTYTGDSFYQMIGLARINSGDSFQEFVDKLKIEKKELYEEVRLEILNGLDEEEYLNRLTKAFDFMRQNTEYIDNTSNGKLSNYKLYIPGLKDIKLDYILYSDFVDSSITSREVAEFYFLMETMTTYEKKEEVSGIMETTDILDAIYQGTLYDYGAYTSNGEYVSFPGHGSEYYSEPMYIFTELIANYTSLKILGNEGRINYLRTLVGDDIINCIDEHYQLFLKYNLN